MSDAAERPRLAVVATPIGNLSDLSPRAASVLSSADVVFAEDTRVSRVLLAHIGSRARLESLHTHNERGATKKLLLALENGERVALVSDAGTPLVSDPGAYAVACVIAAGFAIEPVPGPSAVAAALSVCGFSCVPYAFYGFFERGGGAQADQLAQMRAFPGTVVFFETKHRIASTLALCADRLGPERDAVVCRELTKRYETVHRGALSVLAQLFLEQPVRGELTIILAPKEPDVVQELAEKVIAELRSDARPLPQRTKELMTRTGLSRHDAYTLLRKPC